MKNQEIKKGEIIIYKTPQKEAELRVKLEQESVWLSLDQMAILFDRDKSVISRHIGNVFKEKELNKKSVVAKFATTAADGKIYQVDYYNLDVIISIGYRVKSQNGVRFRIWASKILKQYIIQGYAINEERLLQAQDNFEELQNTINFLQEKSRHKLLAGQEREILNLLAIYSKTLTLLNQYDHGKLSLAKRGRSKFNLSHENAQLVIHQIKKELISKKEASELFGQESRTQFKGILGNIHQTFDGRELYTSLEEKASHLLYFIIKDYPFVDGNKRIGSFLFIYFLDKNNYLYKKNGEKKINDNALTALSLLVAISDPEEKNKLVKTITNLLTV